jgi:hypothetical protein
MDLLKMTINEREMNKALFAHALKLGKHAHATIKSHDDMIALILSHLVTMDKIINRDVAYKAEKQKDYVIDEYLRQCKSENKYFYIASGHDDCAEDHKEWQDRLYVDATAPSEVIEIARKMELYTIQYVMGSPAWFMTRPNCRHYVVGVTTKEVQSLSVEEIIDKYHTHHDVGSIAISRIRNEKDKLLYNLEKEKKHASKIKQSR